MKPAVSVIVPVYKVEPYLVRCLESLQKQSLRNIEIILVDDASPDRCGEICEQYATKDTRFKVIHHTKNKGPAAARNTGLRQATADYLMFVDSDDWVHKDFCKAPYECATSYNSDVVVFRSQRIKKTLHFGSKTKTITGLKTSGYKSREEAIYLLQHGIGQAVWNKLYSKNLFNSISFPDNSLAEDFGITYKIIWASSRIFYLNKVLYYYCYRTNSITTLDTEKRRNDWFEMAMQQYYNLSNWGYPAHKLDLLLKGFAIRYCIQYKERPCDNHYHYFVKILQTSKNIPEDYTWRLKAGFLLLKYCPTLFDVACDMFNKRIRDYGN